MHVPTRRSSVLLAFVLLLLPITPMAAFAQDAGPEAAGMGAQRVYLPLANQTLNPQVIAASQGPQVNVPYFAGDIPFNQTGITWFGEVGPQSVYADVRLGYNDAELYVHLNVIDRMMWYDESPSPDELMSWDGVTLYLNTNNGEGAPGSAAFRLAAGYTFGTGHAAYQVAYRGTGSGWTPADVPFQTELEYRGNAPNNDLPDRGWWLVYRIPFSSLGVSRPPEGTAWRLGVQVANRLTADGSQIVHEAFPDGMDPNRPDSWRSMVFGLPGFTAPPATPRETVTIRHGLNGAVVKDADVGASTGCGHGLDFFYQWGTINYAGADKVNIANQSDIADWPCFAKFYVSFPIESVPANKVILSAKVTLWQFGNSGAGWTPPPEPSLIQVFTIGQDWDEGTINWNNAPEPVNYISRSWVDVMGGPPDQARSWDVTQAVTAAYASGQPVRLVFYSADAAMHSGKYFYSSDVADWNAGERPTLEVLWGDP